MTMMTAMMMMGIKRASNYLTLSSPRCDTCALVAMSPWIPAHVPRDQYVRDKTAKKWMLPWQDFPADELYLAYVAIVMSAATYAHYAPWGAQHRGGWEHGLLRAAAEVFGLVCQTAILSLPLCLCAFVAACYRHSHKCAAAAARVKATTGGPADCTKHVVFRDAGMQQRYRGRSIDMETLYELYFDEKIDVPEGKCLMNDVLSQRHEFVTYTFGLTTHLVFLVTSWIPAVLTHSKGGDKEMVRDHYDRSKFYEEQQEQEVGKRDQNTPFTSDQAEDDFFGMFLGPAMVYTSGISQQLLTHAQQAQLSGSGGDGTGSAGSGSSSSQGGRTAAAAQNASGMQQVQGETLEHMQECKIKMICRCVSG